MIKALKGLDANSAVGLLARVALSLGYLDSPTPRKIAGEEGLRKSVIEEVRSRLGLAADDQSEAAVERMADVLDAEADCLMEPPDTEAALSRLAERGDLPSDLYEINIIPEVSKMHGRSFPLEKDLIETTIRAPTIEQHYGPLRGPLEPSMISLFLKTFRTRWAFKDFAMLVAAGRNGFILNVHQAWRIYPSAVNVEGLKAPIDWLRKFADVYGADVQIGDKKAHFFLFVNKEIPPNFKWETPPGKTIIVSRFSEFDPFTRKERAALIIGVDRNKYMRTLSSLGVRREDILEDFARPPKPRD
jgi:hypothetical protein